jgi:hypothetical protein
MHAVTQRLFFAFQEHEEEQELPTLPTSSKVSQVINL